MDDSPNLWQAQGTYSPNLWQALARSRLRFALRHGRDGRECVTEVLDATNLYLLVTNMQIYDRRLLLS